MKKLFAITMAGLFAACISLGAQSLDFLGVSPDIRTLSMGGSGTALEANAFAARTNAASAALSEDSFAAALSYKSWAPDGLSSSLVDFGGYWHSGKLAVGVIGSYNGMKSYETYSFAARSLGTYSPKEFAAGLNFSYRILEPLSLGVTLRFVSSDLAEKAKGSAIGADIAAMYRKGPFSAGLSLNNVGSKISYEAGAVSQPSVVKAGASYSIAGLTASAEADWLFDGALMAGLGLEYGLADLVFLRAGYHHGAGDIGLASFASLGAGVKYSGFTLDAAFLMASESLAGSMGVSLGYKF